MKMSPGRSFLLLNTTIVVFITGIFGCDDGDNKSAESDTASDAGGAADVVSGATPGVARAALTDMHEGAGKANCFECHDSFHVNNYSVGDCVSCHGRNQSPDRPEDHADLGCVGCHADRHPDLTLESEDACRACHLPAPVADGECAYTETYDVAIIGGGGGGLAAAAALSEKGFSTVLVEQHYKVGGCMVTFKRGEYQFEASLHAYDGWGIGYLNALGLKDAVTPVAGDIMYRLVYPDLTFDVPADKSAYRDALKETFPDEADNIDALFTGYTVSGNGYPGMSLLEAVESYGITDERVTAIFTILSGFLAATPDEVPADEFLGMWESYHQMGYYYFEGGSQAITDALTAQIRAEGGVIKQHTRASKITVADGKVTGIRTTDGGCYTAPVVISDASAEATYLSLVGEEHLPEALADAIKNGTPAPSNLAIVFLGVDADFTEYFPGGTHEIFVQGAYRRSPAEIDEIQCQPEAVDYMLSNYSVLDPTAAPDGKNAIVITADYMGYDCNNAWRFDDSYDSYEAYKQTVADVLIARAEEILPGLSSHIEVMEVASPKTVEQFTLSPRGSWAGWAFDKDSGEDGPTPLETEPLEGLFTAGAWVGGSGQSVALSTGISAATAARAYISP